MKMSSSYVWKQFSKSKNKKNTAICNHCSKEILCKGSSTSGLTRHISSQHKNLSVVSEKLAIQGTSKDSSDSDQLTSKIAI